MSNYSSKKLPRIVDYVGDTVFLGVIVANPELASVLTSHDFDFAQTNVIIGASRRGLDITKIKLCATGEYSDIQMSFIYSCFLDLNMSLEDVSKFLDPKLSKYQMDIIAAGVKLGVDVTLYNDYHYHPAQMEVLLNCLKNRIDSRIVELIRDTRFSTESMKALFYAAVDFEHALTYEELQVVANSEFNASKINLLLGAYVLDFSIDQVKNLADVYSADQINEILKAVEEGISDDKLSFVLDPKLSHCQMHSIVEAIKCGLSCEQLKVLANVNYSSGCMDIIAQAYLDNNPYIDSFLNSDISEERFALLANGWKEGFAEEQLKYLMSKELMDCYANEAYKWFSSGLSIEQFEENSGKFDSLQLAQIRSGLVIKPSYLHLYDNPKLTFDQMYEVIRGIEKGCNEEGLRLYADTRISPNFMRTIANDLVAGVPVDIIKKYVRFNKKGRFDIKEFDRRERILKKEILKRMYE